MSDGDILIGEERPDRPDVGELITALDRQMRELYPPESNHLLDAEELAREAVRFFVARRGCAVVGCAALVAHDGYGEVKRMYVRPEVRGLGLGRRLLLALEEAAASAGLELLRLETGTRSPEAVGLYRSVGFMERPHFGDYAADPLSLFMEKSLARQVASSVGSDDRPR